MKNPNNLLEDVKKCMVDPISDLLLNFSLEKSEEWYEKRKKQRDSWNYKQNPAVKKEEVSFDFGSLSELWLMTTQAHNLYVNLKKEEFNKWVDWYIYGQNIVVSWYRLKPFDEWLHDWIKEALILAYQFPEDGARKVLERGLGKWTYTNTAIHMYIEWKIDEGTLKRLWQYEGYQNIDDRDVEKDVEEVRKALLWIEEDNKKEVKVLTFKLTGEWIEKL